MKRLCDFIGSSRARFLCCSKSLLVQSKQHRLRPLAMQLVPKNITGP